MTTDRTGFLPWSILVLILVVLVVIAQLTHRTEPGITWAEETPEATPLVGVTPDKKIAIHRGTALGKYCTEVWLEDRKRRTVMTHSVNAEWDAPTAYAFGYLDGYCAEYLELDPALEDK